jgi:CheY-like chemotaxis protein
MSAAAYACVFTRAPRERLVAAERLVRALPRYLAGTGAQVSLFHRGNPGWFAAVVHADGGSLGSDAERRLEFWAARTGGRGVVVAALAPEPRRAFDADLAACDHVERSIPLGALEVAGDRFFRELGTPPPSRDGGGLPVLALDLDGPGGEGIGYDAERRALFLAGVLAPPVGDEVTLMVRARARPRAVEGHATVVAVRGRDEAGAGTPAGFTLRVDGAELHALLAARDPGDARADVRAAPRFAVSAPVRVTPAAGGGAAAAAPAPGAGVGVGMGAGAPPARALLEYATDAELHADWIENLSQGGAFVRTSRPQQKGSEVVLELALPDGVRLEAKGVVVFASASGMGIRFQLGPEQDALLASAIARISARTRRALVVDDDALVRAMFADALAGRGFDVVTAGSVEEGVKILADELLTLDVLLTDVCMPGKSGEDLVRFIRSAGGEAELAIVAVSGRLEPGMEQRLEDAGADAVLDKDLGPEMIAQAADAALERKRMIVSGAGEGAGAGDGPAAPGGGDAGGAPLDEAAGEGAVTDGDVAGATP